MASAVCTHDAGSIVLSKGIPVKVPGSLERYQHKSARKMCSSKGTVCTSTLLQLPNIERVQVLTLKGDCLISKEEQDDLNEGLIPLVHSRSKLPTIRTDFEELIYYDFCIILHIPPH